MVLCLMFCFIFNLLFLGFLFFLGGGGGDGSFSIIGDTTELFSFEVKDHGFEVYIMCKL